MIHHVISRESQSNKYKIGTYIEWKVGKMPPLEKP